MRKRDDWSGGIAEWTDGNTTFLSVAFTWCVPDAYSRALFAKCLGKRVIAGGPAFATAQMRAIMAEVAEVPTKRTFARGAWHTVPADHADGTVVQRMNPNATFASRGCPVGCSFCTVPVIEGEAFTLLPDFVPRPILCDNNLSALPDDYQRHIIEKYQAHGVPLMDANSGFEPMTFDGDTYERWKAINRGPWRYAYDESKEGDDVLRVSRILEAVPAKNKRVYVLIGNEPFEPCMRRILQTIEWGCEPHVQPYMKLNALEKVPHVRFDWTERKLRDVARWANRRVWRTKTFDEYRPSAHTARDFDPMSGQPELFT